MALYIYRHFQRLLLFKLLSERSIHIITIWLLPTTKSKCWSVYHREYNIPTTSAGGGNTAAVMEGKLKEKLESVGIAFLCLAQGSPNIIQSFCKYIYVSFI